MMKSFHHCNTQQVHFPCFQQYGEYQGKKINWNSRNNGNQAWNSNKSSWRAVNENKNSNQSFGDPRNKDSNWGKKSNWNFGSSDANENTIWRSNSS